jgi:hypothetical protein
MKQTYRSRQILVLDDFLSSTEWDDLFSYCNRDTFSLVHATQWRKVWRLADGFPLQGTTTLHAPNAPPVNAVGADKSAPDIFARRVIDVLGQAAPVIGETTDWRDFTVSPWIYPVGSGLSLHQDGKPKLTGSYTYFLHKMWNIHWGGHLVVLDPGTNDACTYPDNREKFGPFWIVDEEENKRVWDPAIGICIFPRPNRLVFLSSQAQHLITRVDAAAGQNARLSVGGFFRRYDGQSVLSN